MKWQIPTDPIAELQVCAQARDDNYHQLLDVVSRHCNRFSLIWRGDSWMYHPELPSKRLMEFSQQLSPYLLEEEHVSEWPSTRLLGVDNKPRETLPVLRVYESRPDAINVLKRTRPSLFHWLVPHFPEDPCFYFDDGDCCLVTCSHEDGAAVYVPKSHESLLVALDPLLRNGALVK